MSSCFGKTLLVAVAALVGLSNGRKSKSASHASSQDVNWLLGLQKPLSLDLRPGSELVPATSDQVPGFLTQHEGQEVSVSDASQLDVSQLTSVTMKPESVTMKPETALISQKSQSSQSAAGGSHTSAASQKSEPSPDDVMLRELEQSIMALAKSGKASNVSKEAVEDIEVIIDNMTVRIFAISDDYRAAVKTAESTIVECLTAWSATAESGRYPPSVCSTTNSSASPSAAALLSSKDFADTASTPRTEQSSSFLEMGMTHGRKTHSPPAGPDALAPCTHLLVQRSNINSTEIILNHQQNITYGTLLKIDIGGSNEEFVEVKLVGPIVKLARPLLFDHSIGTCAEIYAFGTDYYDHLQGASCNTTGHCLGNGISSFDHLVDPVPLRDCRVKQNASWKKYEEKRVPLYSMGLLRDDLCGVFRANSSDNVWPGSTAHCAPLSLDDIDQFYDDSYNYYLEYHNQLVEANKSCQEATDNYDGIADEANALLVEYQKVKIVCDRMQDNMDNKACDARENMGRCELGYGDCYHRQVDHTLSEYAKANKSAVRYTQEMSAILRIRCLLDALTAPSTEEVDDKIAACSHAYYQDHPNVTYLAVDPPSIPCPGQCESLPYQPGTKPYEDHFYTPYQEQSHPCNVRCCHNESSSFTTRPIYVLGAFSENVCAVGTSPIKDVNECESAQAFLDNTLSSTVTDWQGDVSSPDWPSYCHQVTGLGIPGVWWNSDTTGSSRPTARPICKDMYIPGPKAPRAAPITWCQNTRMPLPLAKQSCDLHKDCGVVLGDDCDDGSSNWFYCRTDLNHLLSNLTSSVLDACTKVKLVANAPPAPPPSALRPRPEYHINIFPPGR